MVQLIFIVLLAAAGLMLYRRFVADAERLRARSKRAEKERETGAMGTLVKDPKTGEYHVRHEDAE